MEIPSEYYRGLQDFREGKPHQAGQSEDYNNAYNDSYWLQESITGQQLERENEYNRRTQRAV